MRRVPGRQRGITLFVTMILLILITLVAVTTFNAGRSSMQIVGNLQQRNDSVAAAQEAIETAISTTKLLDTPAAIISPGCGGTANTVCVDVNGDGTNDVTVAIKGHGATGNPGCHMQIGAGLLAAGLRIRVAHPVELLDWSYRAGGVYK